MKTQQPALNGLNQLNSYTADLVRMGGLQQLMRVQNYEDDATCEQYRKVQERLTTALMPLVELMVSAGLLTIALDADLADVSDYIREEYSGVSFDTLGVFQNGNIWICAGESSGHSHYCAEPGSADSA